MSPYKPHHRGVQLKGLNLVFLVRRYGRNFKEVRHPSDGTSSIYRRHRIAVVDFNFVSIHLLHSGAYPEGGTLAGDGKYGSIMPSPGRVRSRNDMGQVVGRSDQRVESLCVFAHG